MSRPLSAPSARPRPAVTLAVVMRGKMDVKDVAPYMGAQILGAFVAGPGASETIHEAVLAVKLRLPLAVLEDTIHAFPTVARVLGTAFINADRELAG